MKTIQELKKYDLDELKELYRNSNHKTEMGNIIQVIKEKLVCWGCGVDMEKNNTPKDYSMNDLINMELIDDGFFCVKCDKERYPFLYKGVK